MKRPTVLTLIILFVFASAGCDSAGTHSDDPALRTAWEQDFDASTEGWLGAETTGASGWCGEIGHIDVEGGPVAPSDGSGYAVVEQGACNAYWQEQGFASSAPYGPFGAYFDAWPTGGFAGDLDVYLDPDWSASSDGALFTYAASIRLLDREYPENFRYFYVPVTKDGGRLLVAGRAVTEAGWYTFRHRFSSEDGALAVDFALLRGGQVLFTQPVTSTAVSEEAPASFETSNVGNGYAWFVAIRPDLRLPIDEHRLLQDEQSQSGKASSYCPSTSRLDCDPAHGAEPLIAHGAHDPH